MLDFFHWRSFISLYQMNCMFTKHFKKSLFYNFWFHNLYTHNDLFQKECSRLQVCFKYNSQKMYSIKIQRLIEKVHMVILLKATNAFSQIHLVKIDSSKHQDVVDKLLVCYLLVELLSSWWSTWRRMVSGWNCHYQRKA